MAAEQDVYDALRNAAAVTAVCSTRIYPDVIPQEKALPAVAYVRAGTEFVTTIHTGTPTPLENRYGITQNGFGYLWHTTDPRFDVNANANEPNRFGWIVEIDPFTPGSTIDVVRLRPSAAVR